METGLGLWVGVRACVTADTKSGGSCCVAVLGRASCDPLCVLVGQCKGRVRAFGRSWGSFARWPQVLLLCVYTPMAKCLVALPFWLLSDAAAVHVLRTRGAVGG